MEDRSRQILAEKPDGLPKVMRMGVGDHLADRIALYEQHGFAPARYFYKMRRDLSLPLEDAPLPAGVTLKRWSPDLDEAARQVFNESFLDHWGFEPVPPDFWQTWFTAHPNFLPGCSFLAMDGDRAVSMCIAMNRQEDNQATGDNEGWIQDVGTLRPYRRQGIAAALMTESMKAFAEHGFTCAGLGVDVTNPTGALGIYERLGFKVRSRMIVYEKIVKAGE
jgi:ribosomal protein S18 acetylase RimI-like enzyme